MTRLQSLQVDLRSIPSKRQRAELVGKLITYADKVSNAAETLKQTVAAERYATNVFPDLAPGSVTENRRKAQRLANRLERRLTDDIAKIRQSSTDSDVSSLVDHARLANQSVQNRWRSHLSGKLQGYQTLLDAARQAGLARGQDIGTALTLLRQRVDAPPADERDAQTIIAALEQLTESISELGLEGEAGGFIVAASRGEGDAQALSKPEIRDFIDRHDLWRFLRVTFR
jgi:hypothetical protein